MPCCVHGDDGRLYGTIEYLAIPLDECPIGIGTLPMVVSAERGMGSFETCGILSSVPNLNVLDIAYRIVKSNRDLSWRRPFCAPFGFQDRGVAQRICPKDNI